MSATFKQYTDIDFLAELKDILKEFPTATQREIGDKTGVSAAVINALLKRCLERGWIAVSRMDGRKLRYMLSAEGLTALTKRSIAFMQRNFSQLSAYKKNIDNSIRVARAAGKTKLTLYGSSQIDFLIVESCRAYGMEFETKDTSMIPGASSIPEDEFAIIGESVQRESYEVTRGGMRLATVYAIAR